MDTQRNADKSITPPRLIGSLTAGFNAVTNNIGLIIFPIALDLFLWLGPRLRLKALLEPMINDSNRRLLGLAPPEAEQMLSATQELWHLFIDRFNLLSLLRIFPVGVPSLLASQGALETPLGLAPIVEMPTLYLTLFAILFIIFMGILFGSVYYNGLAQVSLPTSNKTLILLPQITRQFLQSIFLTFCLLILILIISIPSSFVISIAMLINPVLAQIALFVLVLFLFWVLLPLIFSPHGIFVFQQNALHSMLTSLQLVRFLLPGTSLFLLAALLLNEGLNALWSVPPAHSWLTLVGISGHAFISTGILAASFIYYRKGIAWMQENIKRFTATKINA